MGIMEASSFNQQMGNWDTDSITNYGDFATNSALISANAPSKDETKFQTTQD